MRPELNMVGVREELKLKIWIDFVATSMEGAQPHLPTETWFKYQHVALSEEL